MKKDSMFPPLPFTGLCPLRITTYESASKYATLSIFRMNTYEKPRGEGVAGFANKKVCECLL
jgi:hypothetical protein